MEGLVGDDVDRHARARRRGRPHRIRARAVHSSSFARRPSASASSSAHEVFCSFVSAAGLPAASNLTQPSAVEPPSARASGPGAVHLDRAAGDLRRDRRQPALVAEAVRAVEHPPGRRGEQERRHGQLQPQRRGRVARHPIRYRRARRGTTLQLPGRTGVYGCTCRIDAEARNPLRCSPARLGRLDDGRLAAARGAAATSARSRSSTTATTARCSASAGTCCGSREEAEDALQQTFLRAHRALATHGAPRTCGRGCTRSRATTASRCCSPPSP